MIFFQILSLLGLGAVSYAVCIVLLVIKISETNAVALPRREIRLSFLLGAVLICIGGIGGIVCKFI